MKAKTSKILLFSLLAAMLIGACANPWKLVEQGKYDEAIAVCVKKLSGKKKKKAEDVKTLEQAFARATKDDMRLVETLKKENREENWVKINDLHHQIRLRQELIKPLISSEEASNVKVIYDAEGRKAEFRFVKIEDREIESKNKAADFCYGEGKRLLAQAEKGDKMAARQAFDEFEKIGKYYPRFKDEDELMKRALELGVVHVLFKMENNSRAILPKDFEREIKRISVSDLDTRWRNIHINPETSLDYDYHIIMRLTAIDVSPEERDKTEYVDDKTIEEGWEYELDKNGNVKKDSAGNDLKTPKKVLIKANILEIYQHKAAHVGGTLEFRDNRSNELIQTMPLAVEYIWENHAATFKSGDKRALSEESKKKIETGNVPVDFPSDEALVLEVANRLKQEIKAKIAKSKILN